MRYFVSLVAALMFSSTGLHAAQQVVFLEAEQFGSYGGWVLDQQFMDQMGSPYLLAHGLGDPVTNAVTKTQFEAGKYRVWVRTRDWVAPWKAKGAPGRFQVLLNGKPLKTTFGTEGAEWHWQDGGVTTLKGETTIALHDLTGFEGRCDAILFCADLEFSPPNGKDELARFRREALGLPEAPVDGGTYDLVVVGGGIAGSAAAIGAARLGLTVALIQDRPVLGGNGSSEVRVWPEGKTQQQPYPRVGDLVSELVANKTSKDGNAKPSEVYNDARKLEVARAEPNLTLLLEQRVNGVEVSKGVVAAVMAQDLRSGVRKRIRARWFADCTGDATVGFLAGADHEVTSDQHMGASNLWRVEDEHPKRHGIQCECTDTNALSTAVATTTALAPFPRCAWAVNLTDKPFPGRAKKGAPPSKDALGQLGGWFWESGFGRDPIEDMEWTRDLNLRAMYGAWDTLKNVDKLYPNHKLTWAAYIAGKRESRRLLGDVILQGDDFLTNNAYADGAFPCSWHIDLHTPHPEYSNGHAGEEFISTYTRGQGYTYKSPYWAPYRCLYSRNINNLFMAGRDISVTHEALGAVRVMRTCGMMGEIVAMAAAICKQQDCTPREVYSQHLEKLKTSMTRGVGKESFKPAS